MHHRNYDDYVVSSGNNYHNNYYSANDNRKSYGTRQSVGKLNDVRSKFHQVIDMCKGENQAVGGNLTDVVSAEKNILNLLLENPQILQNQQALHKVSSHHNFHPHNQYPIQPNRQPPIQTPLRQSDNYNNYIPQSQYYIPNFSQVGGAKENYFPPNISHSNILRPESSYHEQVAPNPNLQNSFNMLKNSKQVQLSDEAIHLIEQIQRKAFQQIEKLRHDKLVLMQKLNDQIKNTNAEKRKAQELQIIIQGLSGKTGNKPDGSRGDAQQLKTQLSAMQDQLYRTKQLNNNLQKEISVRGSGVPGIEELLRQGEIIRQETLRLIKLKEAQLANQSHHYQEKSLNSPYVGNNANNSYQSIKRAISPGYGQSRQTNGGTKTVQYEDLVSQMKRITGF